VGLQEYFADEAPDLVVSGANFGPNLGFAGSSGTVGAATMAANIGVPAIAVSVGINPAEQDQSPIPFPSTFKAFAGAAELTSTLISDLQKNRSGEDGLLPVGTILNINYPPLTPDALRGVRVSLSVFALTTWKRMRQEGSMLRCGYWSRARHRTAMLTGSGLLAATRRSQSSMTGRTQVMSCVQPFRNDCQSRIHDNETCGSPVSFRRSGKG
jgi:5'/3'-nucleotidase SurE